MLAARYSACGNRLAHMGLTLLRTAVSFQGQLGTPYLDFEWIVPKLSPKRDWSSKSVSVFEVLLVSVATINRMRVLLAGACRHYGGTLCTLNRSSIFSSECQVYIPGVAFFPRFIRWVFTRRYVTFLSEITFIPRNGTSKHAHHSVPFDLLVMQCPRS